MASLALHPPTAASSYNDHDQDQGKAALPPPTHNSNVVVFEQTIDVEEDVADFFNARFNSREDLANIKSVLQKQAAIGDELNHKVLAFLSLHASCVFFERVDDCMMHINY